MTISRRDLLGGLAGILATGVAPAIVTQPMKIYVPKKRIQAIRAYGEIEVYPTRMPLSYRRLDYMSIANRFAILDDGSHSSLFSEKEKGAVTREEFQKMLSAPFSFGNNSPVVGKNRACELVMNLALEETESGILIPKTS